MIGLKAADVVRAGAEIRGAVIRCRVADLVAGDVDIEPERLWILAKRTLRAEVRLTRVNGAVAGFG